MTKRKRFSGATDDENSMFSKDGLVLYLELRNKYGNQTEDNLDYILNTLCAALVYLITRNSEKDSHMQLLQSIYKILLKNIERNQ